MATYPKPVTPNMVPASYNPYPDATLNFGSPVIDEDISAEMLYEAEVASSPVQQTSHTALVRPRAPRFSDEDTPAGDSTVSGKPPSYDSAATPTVSSPARRRFLLDDEDEHESEVPPAAHSEFLPVVATNLTVARTAPSNSTEAIALIKAIMADVSSTVDESILSRAVTIIDNANLQELGTLAVKGFRCSRLIKATVLTEAKARFGNNGSAGRRSNGEISWTTYCEAIGEPRGTADTLVKALEVYRKMNPILREAANKESIDLLKPKVQLLLQMKQEEMWSLQATELTTITEWVAQLRAAEGRLSTLPAGLNEADESAKVPAPATISAVGADDVADSESVEDCKPQPKAREVRGPGGKVVNFTGSELARYEELLRTIRAIGGYDNSSIAEPEIVILALDSFAAELEAKHATANPRG
jgi:hypothetical protein